MEPRQIAAGVWVFTSRVMATTSVVVAGGQTAAGRGALLIDPAWEPDELEGIADWLERSGLTVVVGWATHAHYDHVLWHPRLGGAPRYATPETARRAHEQQRCLVAGLGPEWPAELAPLVGDVIALQSDRIPWDGPAVRVIEHHAHARGHGALWLEEAGVLVAGDMLSDIEIPIPDEEGLAGYRKGLAALEPFVRQAAFLVPGHGSVAARAGEDTPIVRLERDTAYLDALRGNLEDPRLRGAPDWLLDQDERNRDWLT
jgi:glyoxylase-like metal-dependent hydrolase (beta-lactamase superfamily II)